MEQLLLCSSSGLNFKIRCRLQSDRVTRSSRELQGQVEDECGSVQFRQ